MDPCTFLDKKNPADPTQTCTETFIKSSGSGGGGGGGNGYDSDSCSSSSSSSKQKSKCKYKYAAIRKNKIKQKKKKDSKRSGYQFDKIDFSKLPDDVYVKAFYACISIFSLYVLYRFIQRYNKK